MCPKDQAPLEEVGKDPIIGALIDDRYVIDSVIGKGSSGIVYKASRLMMGGDVAVKVIHSYLGADSASLDRLLRELKAAERLRHAHVITVWDSGTTDDGQPYLVMDYCEGITLSQLITQKGALPPKRVLNVLRQVTEALAHAHEQGFIHRDMKPENIVLEESELRGDYVKVLDFGIADTPAESAQRAKFNKPKTVAGSPAYMSPEQCQGFELDYRSDLYSLAVIAFEMFTGRRPFLAHDLMKLMYMTVTEPPPKMGQVRKDLSFPDRVEAVISKALSKLPDDRQPTIRDFWKELEQACEGLDFGKSDRVKAAPPREQQNIADLEILPSERLVDDDKPKRPQFEAGPEDMPELFMPPPPPPKSAEASADAPAAEPAKPASPPPPGGAPARGPGIASLVNKQQPPGASPAPAKPASPVTPGPSVSGTVKPLQPTRIGPGGAKLPAAPPKPGDPQRPPAPGGPRPPGPAGGPTGGKPPGPPGPPGPPKAPPPPGAPGSGGPRPGGGPPPSPTAAPPLPVKPPSPTPNPSNGPAMGLESSDAYSQFPDKTMSRLSALVKRPTSSMAVPSAADIAAAPAKPAPTPAPEPAPERPPSVYSYVPPKEEKPAPEPEAKTESNNNQNPNAPKAAPLQAKPGGPAGQGRPGGPGGPGGPRPGGPAGAKPGGPNQVRPGGAPQGSKPGGGPNPGGPSGAKPGMQNRPAGSPGGPSGSKPGEGPSGNKPGAGPTGGKPAPTGVKVAPKPGSGAPGGPGSSSQTKPGESTKPGQSSKPEPAKAEPNKSESNKSDPSAPATKEHDDITPALARAGATWVESSAEWDSMAGGGLDGNVLDESKQAAQRRISNLDWEDEIEALKTGSVEPIVIDPGPGGELLNPQQPGAWPPGMVPPGGQNPMPGQMPPQGMPPQGMPPGYPPQNWPPGMVPGQPMMPGYDQNMSYPPGMMHPYMQPPGYPPPGYPLPPNQDVSGAYPMMPNYPPMPPPGQDVSGQYQIPGYMPPGQGYQYGVPGMPMMPGMPGMPPHGMPPQGMPPGMVPQGMPPGMVPQGMPPGMVPQGYPPGMPPQGMPPFMSPSLPDAVSGSPGGLGSALLDDLKSDFGETPQGDSLDDLFEDVPPEEAPALPKADEKKIEPVEDKKTEVEKESEPVSRNEDLAVPLDKFEKFEETDESLKQKELAAKSEAEAAELGDSLLALMDSTEKDRGFGADKTESKAKEPEKKEASPKSTGSRALGSLLGALTASDDDLEEPAENEESGGNAFAAAVASSASVPSLTEKSKKSGSAFGQLLAAVKEDDEDEPSEDDDDSANAGGASLPKQAISDALDDLLGPDDPSASVNRAPAMKNPFEADDSILGDGNAIVKPSDSFPTAAARLASALSEADDEPEPPYASVDPGSIMSGAAPQNPSTSTSDALSRLLEAASKAPSKASPSESTSGGAAMSEIDKMAARVNKPPAKVSRKLASAKAESGNNPAEPQPFSGFGGGGGAFGGNYAGDQAPAYGGAPDMRASGINSTGSNSSYSQDAVNARIAELNRKLEQQSIGRKDVELPQAPPPDPSVIGDSPNRRDVVNRIMEEAGKRHQYGADYESPEPAPSAKPTVSGSNFNPNELDKVNSSRLASMAEQEQRRKKTRSRNATMPRFPVAPVVGALAIIGLCTAGYFNQGAIKTVWDGIMSSVAPADSTTEKKDSELLAKVNDLVAKGKLNEARKILEQEESARGLPPEWSDKLDTIYISIAKYKKNAGATPEAIKTLELIPNESSHYQDAQKLIKQYKGSKKSSSKRKRR